MNAYLRNILVVIGGWIIGNLVNGGIVALSFSIFSFPQGIDPSDIDNFDKLIPFLGVKHYLFALAAHSLATIAGVYFVARLVTKAPAFFGFGLGLVFFLQGIGNAWSMPFPFWFEATDLVVSYIPMTLLANVLAKRKRSDW